MTQATHEKSNRLSDFARDKNNNFNLIRVLAALAVLYSHSFALLRLPEPLQQSLGKNLGYIAVDVFFTASGFLVAGSLLVKQNLPEYLLARILRIYPALILMLLVVVLLLGAAFTELSLSDYYAHPMIYFYFKKCLLLLNGLAYYLPGVFERNPYQAVINSSLWSLVYEVQMYLILAGLWLISGLFKSASLRVFKTLIVFMAVSASCLAMYVYFTHQPEEKLFRTAATFFTGASCYVFRSSIRLSTADFLVVCCALGAALLMHIDVFSVIYGLCLTYILLYLAYVPNGVLRRYNALGDYSYGIYIYAFPVQQAVIASFPKISVIPLSLLAMLFTLMLSVFSWYAVERRALKYKNTLITRFHSSISK